MINLCGIEIDIYGPFKPNEAQVPLSSGYWFMMMGDSNSDHSDQGWLE